MAPTPQTIERKRATPFEFMSQVRDEASKVTWPSRREVTVTTAMVFGFVLVASLFLTALDIGFRHAVAAVLGA